jgi:hypothetical protein
MNVSEYWTFYPGKYWENFADDAIETIKIFTIEDINFLFLKIIENGFIHSFIPGTAGTASKLLEFIGEEFEEFSEYITSGLLDIINKKFISNFKNHYSCVIETICGIGCKKLRTSVIETLLTFRKYVIENEFEFNNGVLGELNLKYLYLTINHCLKIFLKFELET